MAHTEPPRLDDRQMKSARIVKLLSSIFLTGFAMVGMLSLAGIPGVGLRLWIGFFTATAVSLFFHVNDHKYPRVK